MFIFAANSGTRQTHYINMKLIHSYLFRSLCTIMIGLLLILNPDTPIVLIQVIAALFAVSGLFSVTNYLITRFGKSNVRPAVPLAGLGSLLFGIVLGMYPDAFLQFLMYFLGGMILLLGFSQLVSIFHYRKVAPIRWTVFLVPVLIIVAGFVVLVHYRQVASLPFVILGVCCIFHGLSDLFYGLRLRHFQRQQKQYEEKKEEIEDAVIVEAAGEETPSETVIEDDN